MDREKYVLDTNVIFKDPYILNEFENSDIILPFVVLEELDKHKNNKDLGIKVRIFSRILEDLFINDYKMDNGNQISFFGAEITEQDLLYLGGYANDNIISHIAKITNSTLVTEDILLKIKSRELGKIDVISFTQKSSNNNIEDFYNGYFEYFLEDRLIDTLYKNKYLDIRYIDEINIYPHMFIILKRFSGQSGDLICKVDKDMKFIELINPLSNIYGINPKNIQQLIALHLLLDKDIPLVTLSGAAGTGKTLLALASALALDEKNEYANGITCTTPIIDMGKELGTLPGDKEEKLSPYIQSYYDALEFLFGSKENLYNALNSQQLNLEIDALNYIRGRSIPDKYFIVDEAQNLTKHEIKTIVTRMSEGSKLVIMGDVEQIDAKFLDKYNNGLTHLINSFKESKFHGHVTFAKTVRSELASEAAKLL